MNGDGSDVGSGLTRSLADFVRDVGLAVAEGQHELDNNSLTTQLAIERDAEEGRIPHTFEAPWYRFAEVDVDMRLQVDTTLESHRGRDETTFYRPRLTVSPTEPARGERTGHVDASSSIRFRIVPVPPNMPSGRTGDRGTSEPEAPDGPADDEEGA